eukprot:SM000004S14905  [mRNA]  locus=s4:104226:107152:- [translate_table: standard]
MFKKASEVRLQQRLSGADRKKLRRSLQERFPALRDADLDLLLPAKAPSMLPALELKGGEVSRYILGGADLMLPGVRVPPEGLPSFTEGEPWAVRVPDNNYPIAVGTTMLSSGDATRTSMRGKALHVIHYYGDTLWEHAEGRYVPNDGFQDGIVVEDPARAAPPPDLPAGSGDGNGHVKDQQEDDKQPPEKGTPDPEVAGGVTRLSIDEETHGEPDEEKNVWSPALGAAAPLSAADMDQLLEDCLLRVLRTSVKDKDLPLASSTLWSSHILPARPSGVVLDIKKSSHKKLSKWLQAEAARGLLVCKEDRHRKEVMVIAVNRGHEDYRAFKLPEATSSSEQAQTAGPTDDGPVKERGNAAGIAEVEVVEVWKVTSHVAPIVEAVGADLARYYTAAEAAAVAAAYVEQEKLQSGADPAMVVLDAPLCDALLKGAVKKGTAYPTELHRRDVAAAFVARMQAHHRVSRGSESVVRRGQLHSVHILVERRQGNKKVTKVSGVESFLVDPHALASELQKKFASSTSVSELPGKKDQFEVQVQGGVLEDLGKYLVEHYGIPKKHIEILDKTRRV